MLGAWWHMGLRVRIRIRMVMGNENENGERERECENDGHNAASKFRLCFANLYVSTQNNYRRHDSSQAQAAA